MQAIFILIEITQGIPLQRTGLNLLNETHFVLVGKLSRGEEVLVSVTDQYHPIYSTRTFKISYCRVKLNYWAEDGERKQPKKISLINYGKSETGTFSHALKM